jgi:hypothetical protein
VLEGFLKDIALYGEVEVNELHYADSALEQFSLLLGDDGIDDTLVLEEEEPAEDGEDREDDAQPVSSHTAIDTTGEVLPLECTPSVQGLVPDEPDHQGAQLNQLSLSRYAASIGQVHLHLLQDGVKFVEDDCMEVVIGLQMRLMSGM